MAAHAPVAVLSDSRTVYVPKAIAVDANGDSIVAARSRDKSKFGSLFLARYAADGSTVWTLDTKITKVASDVRLLIAPTAASRSSARSAASSTSTPVPASPRFTPAAPIPSSSSSMPMASSSPLKSCPSERLRLRSERQPGHRRNVQKHTTLDLPGGPTTLTGGKQSLVVASLDPAGNFLWASTFQGKSTQTIGNVVVDTQGKIYLSGGFRGKLDFDPTPAVNLLTTPRTDGFISRFDAATGSLDWIEQIGGNGFAFATNLAVNDQGDLAVIGNFSHLTDLDPTVGGTFEISSKGFVKGSSSEDFFGITVGTDKASSTVNKSNLNNRSQIVSPQFTNVFIIHMHTDGTFVRADTMFGKTASSLEYLALDAAGATYLTGPMFAQIKFRAADAASPTAIDRINNKGNAFAMKWNADGTVAWTTVIGGHARSAPHSSPSTPMAISASPADSKKPPPTSTQASPTKRSSPPSTACSPGRSIPPPAHSSM